MPDPLPLLDVEDLRKEFAARAGLFSGPRPVVRALNGVSFSLARGETLGIVGESGSGKTTAGRCVLRLMEATSGRVRLHGESGPVDVLSADRATLASLRPRMQMIFQDPQSFLDPRMTVGESIAEPLLLNRRARGGELSDRVGVLLEEVGLSRDDAARLPHSLSGGQKQRVGIARALALSPELVIADEPVSALDVSVRAQVLELLARLQRERRIAFVFIGHDLRAVAHVASRIAVMYLGRIVESAPAADLFARPLHPYSESLLLALPIDDPAKRGRARRTSKGEPPDPARIPAGCAFHPRCAYAKEVCEREDPPLVALGAGRAASCHFARELTLEGAP